VDVTDGHWLWQVDLQGCGPAPPCATSWSPFEHVIVAHGEPVHDRAAYERALGLPPRAGESG
jgi:hypothetical protein